MEEGTHPLWPALADSRRSYVESLRKVRVHVADHHLKDTVLGWVRDCYLHAERCRDAGLQILSAGGELRKVGEDGRVVISRMTADDVLEIYRGRVERLAFFEAKANATHGPGIRISPGGGLGGHEDALEGWHTLDRHVNKTLEDLERRLYNSPKMKAASAFISRGTAEEAAGKALAYFEDEIHTWLAGAKVFSASLEVTKDRLVIKSFDAGLVVGYVLPRGRAFAEYTSKVRVVVAKDSAWVLGYRVKTGYPIP